MIDYAPSMTPRMGKIGKCAGKSQSASNGCGGETWRRRSRKDDWNREPRWARGRGVHGLQGCFWGGHEIENLVLGWTCGQARLSADARRCGGDFRGAAHSWISSRCHLPVGWRQELENLARELGYPVTNAEGIEAKFVALVQAIATASVD
jgi:hypothetical protein